LIHLKEGYRGGVLMKKSRQKYLLAFALVMITSISVFFSVEMTESKDNPTGDVVYAISSSSFGRIGGDPVTSNGSNPYVSQTVFEGLTTVDDRAADIPALAKSWHIAENWSHIDINLRDDIHSIKFHNGEPVTAEDVKYSLETFMRPESRWLFKPLYTDLVDKIEIVNPYKIRVHLTGPMLRFNGHFSIAGGIFPKQYREKVGDAGFADKPIGAGPFKWVDYKQDQWFQVEAVQEHYRKTPEIKTLKFIYVPDHATRLAMLRAREVDIAQLSAPHVPAVKADPALRVVLGKYYSGSVLVYADLKKKEEASPFHDIRVRKAASLAIDRKTICEKIFFGTAEPWGEVLNPATLGFDPSVKPDPYSPEAAKALLAEAGYPDGFETTLCGTQGSKYWLEGIQAQLGEVGINAKLEIYEGGAWVRAFQRRRLRGLVTSTSFVYALREAPANQDIFYQENRPWCYVTTPEISKTILQGNSAISDEDLTAAGRKISKLVRESRIRLHLWAHHAVYGVGPKIEYYQPGIGNAPQRTFENIRVKR